MGDSELSVGIIVKDNEWKNGWTDAAGSSSKRLVVDLTQHLIGTSQRCPVNSAMLQDKAVPSFRLRNWPQWPVVTQHSYLDCVRYKISNRTAHKLKPPKNRDQKKEPLWNIINCSLNLIESYGFASDWLLSVLQYAKKHACSHR